MGRRALIAGAVIAGTLAVGGGTASGCGDKFVLMGRGARVARSKFPSSILIFMNPASRIPAAEKEFRLEAMLKAAGHKVRIAESRVEVHQALETSNYDLVLADLTDVPAVRRETRTAASKPAVLPLLYKPTSAELSAAEKEANCLVRPSKQSRDLLGVVDASLRDRRNGVGGVCETTSGK